MTNSSSSYQHIQSTDIWQQLFAANQLLHQGETEQAFDIYSHVVNEHIERYFPPSIEAWPLEDDPSLPSINWACIYLLNYQAIAGGPCHRWLDLVDIVMAQKDYEKLSDCCRSKLISGKARVELGTSRKDFKETILEQKNALSELRLTNLEKAQHHHILGYVYQKLRLPEQAFYHAELATELVDESEDPFYALIYEDLASAYYFLNNFGSDYFTKAIQIYEKLYLRAQRRNQPIDMARQCYSLGWAYGEMGDLFTSMDFFDEAINLLSRYIGGQNQETNGLNYFLAMSKYGKGFVLMSLSRIQDAVIMLMEAIADLQHQKSHFQISMCLQLVAACYEMNGEVDDAVKFAKRSLDLQRLSDNPVQLYHVLRRLVRLHWKRKEWESLSEYYREYINVKIGIRK